MEFATSVDQAAVHLEKLNNLINKCSSLVQLNIGCASPKAKDIVQQLKSYVDQLFDQTNRFVLIEGYDFKFI